MKYIFYLLLLSQIAQAQQSRFKEGETIYVWALNSLNMRKLPDSKSEKITSLPYGTKVTVQANIGVIVAHEVEEFKDFKVKGVWLLVKYGDKEGFVFDGYMSRLVAPKANNDLQSYEQMDEYLDKYFKKAGKVTRDEDNSKTSLIEEFSEDLCGMCTQKYENGIVKKGHFGDGIPQIEYYIPNISLYEGYIFLKVFYQLNKMNHSKRKNRHFFNEKHEDSGGGCSWYLEQIGNKIVFSGYCYC